ncbi:eukaryotic translation initiation factor 2 alpha subunit-domain-containing protein [Lentinula edodes]|nr:eukaryotic translation initiation factor 2 alpha subunit-domain-containing protein [Lentinula edodes]
MKMDWLLQYCPLYSQEYCKAATLIAEMGAYVKLLEYDNTEGMILLSELSRRLVVVLRVDKEKGYIDLSKRRVSPEDITKCEERYMKSKTVASILWHVASKIPFTDVEPKTVEAAPAPIDIGDKDSKKARRAARQAAHDEDGAEELPVSTGNEEDRLEMLYEQIAWPLGKTYGHPYDVFKLSLAEPDTVFGTLQTTISPATKTLLTATIARRLTPQPIKIHADIEVTRYTPAGIDAIKKALKAGEKESNRLERAIESIQSTIEDQGGSLVVKMKPKAVSETDEQDLAQLMAKAGQENAEVSGNEDDEE